MEENDQIIVFRKYDSTIDANLAKTKLDAYGIPCFLTEENLTNLYPLQHLMLFGVRLHIFSGDFQHAEQILNETDPAEPPLTCPVCRSQNIKLDPSTSFGNNLSRFILAFSSLIMIPVKKVYRCRDCEREFKTL